MRRLLIGIAVIALVSGAFALPQNETAIVPAVSGTTEAVVVALGIAARSLSVGSQSAIYVALASPPSRVFSLDTSLRSISAKNQTPQLAAVAGTGVIGSLGDGGAATSAELSLATSLPYERSGVALAADGSIYISDTGNSTIRRIAGARSSEPGVIRSVAGRWAPRQNLTLSHPMGIALDRAGNLYIADQAAGVLDVLHADSGLLETIAQVASPATVAVTADGDKAFVASPETGAVIAIDLHSKSMRAVDGINTQSNSASIAAGTSACSSNSSRVCPAGLAVDPAGNLFVSDATSGRVLRIDAREGTVTTVLSSLQLPGAIAFDQQGRDLYVAEQGLNRIIKAAGMGAPPNALSISPSSWTFANEPIGGASQEEQFTVTNNSASASVSGLSIALQPVAPATQSDYTVESTSCVSTLAVGASCLINISFTPTQVGSLSSAISVTDTGGDSTSSSLSGVGDDFQIQLTTGQSTEVSAPQGMAAVYHLQIAALGVFGQNGEKVSFVCPSGTPLHSVCTVNPASVSPAVGSPAAFTVTVQTSSTITPATSRPFLLSIPHGLGGGPILPALFIVTIGLSILMATKRGSSHLRLAGLLTLMAMVLAGCHHQTIITEATPAGVSTFLVQAVATTQNGASLKASRGITLTIDVIKN